MGRLTMAKIKVKYVVEDVDRHGNVRLYYRKRGERKMRLAGPLGSPEFWDDYNAACRGETPPSHMGKPVKRAPAQPQTLRWLCIEYKRSAAFKGLDERTQYVRGRVLDRLCDIRDSKGSTAGSKPFALMRPRHVRQIRDEIAEFPEGANALVKALRQVFIYAVRYELADYNPAKEVEYLRPNNPDGHHTWTLDEIVQFEERHPIGTKAHLAMSLLFWTSQRRSDVVQFGRQHVRGGRLEFTQFKGRNKSPVRLSIKIASMLQASIDAAPTGDMAFLVTEFGKPFTANGFGNWFRKRCREADLPHWSSHGGRKAFLTLSAECGSSEHELGGMSGHTTFKEIRRYTKKAKQPGLADAALDRVVDYFENRSVPPEDGLVGHNGTED